MIGGQIGYVLKTEMSLNDREDVSQQEALCLSVRPLPVSFKLLIDGILGTLVIFLVLELLICITAMLFGLSVLAAGGTRVSSSNVPK